MLQAESEYKNLKSDGVELQFVSSSIFFEAYIANV